MAQQRETLKKLANPFTAGIGLLVIIGVRAALESAGVPHPNLMYALLPVPLAVLAYSGGMLMVFGGSMIAVLAEILLLSLVFDGDPLVKTATAMGALEKFALMCTFGAVVHFISRRFSKTVEEISGKAEDYLKQLYLQKKKNASALNDAESCVQRVQHDVDMYSSLVLLLEEAAEKIYSRLHAEELIETLFVVLQKCLGADTGALYMLDADEEHYELHSSFGYGVNRNFDRPEILPVGDPLLKYIAASRRAIALYDDAPPDPQVRIARPKSQLKVEIAASLLEQDKVVGILTIHRFKTNRQRDFIQDTSFLTMLCNITSIALTNARLFMKIQDMADRDPLTKLFNRRYFYEALAEELTRARAEEAQTCVLLCDIDHFKSVNDTYGHQAGDAILKGFADTCRENIRECDMLARYGGEEFIFLLPNLGAEEGRMAANRIRKAIAARTFEFEGMKLKITSSCGVAAFPEHASDVSSLTQAADMALYEAKEAGRNRVVVAGEQPTETFADEHSETTEQKPETELNR